MFRKSRPDCKVHYDEIYGYEDTIMVMKRLDYQYPHGWICYTTPSKYSGNNGVLEVFPTKPSNYVIKLEGPMFILEDIYRSSNH